MTTATDSPLPTEAADYRILDRRSRADLRADGRLCTDVGLSADERAAWLARYGPNTLEEKRPGVALELRSYFWQPIPLAPGAALAACLPTGIATCRFRDERPTRSCRASDKDHDGGGSAFSNRPDRRTVEA
jgi:Cation transporter/ATPase, N-terminus